MNRRCREEDFIGECMAVFFAVFIVVFIVVSGIAGCKSITIPHPSVTIPPIAIGPTTTTTQPPIAANDNPLCDPNPAKYNDTYFADPEVARSEEVGLEAQGGIIARFIVLCPQRNSYYMLSSLALGHVRGDRTFDPFTVDGYTYTCKGWLADEPQTSQANTIAVKQTPDKYIIVNCRRAK